MRIRFYFGPIFITVLALFFTCGCSKDGRTTPCQTFSTSDFINVNDVKNLIKIPIIRQGTGYTCGVACLYSVLLYYNRNKSDYQWLYEDSLAKILNTTEKDGTDYLEIVKIAKSKGLEAKEALNMDINSLIKAIDDKKVVICDIQAWAHKLPANYESCYNEGHYVVAIGYDDKNIYFMDPWTVGNYAYLPIEEFLVRWHDTNRNCSGEEIKTENLGLTLWSNIDPEFNPDIITKIE